MSQRLQIFIGGSDKTNGDYGLIHRLAKSGRSVLWSSLKDSRPGDRVLIYIREPVSALIAESEVLAPAMKGKKGQWPYLARLGRIRLLKRPLSVDVLKQEFPKWKWPTYPRGKLHVPEELAEALLALGRQRTPTMQMLITTGTSGLDLLRRLAWSGSAATMSAPAKTRAGDPLLFYAATPVSAIVAAGTAQSDAMRSEEKWYRTRVGEVRMLESPVGLDELRRLFPRWRWLGKVNMFCYLTPEQARVLARRCARPSGRPAKTPNRLGGAGFGSSETNQRVERAAVRRVTERLKRDGYVVVSRETERIGYDLDARKKGTELHVEVKGVSGDALRFPVTDGEVRRARLDPHFVMMVVTNALSPRPAIHDFDGEEVVSDFKLTPISYFAVPRQKFP